MTTFLTLGGKTQKPAQTLKPAETLFGGTLPPPPPPPCVDQTPPRGSSRNRCGAQARPAHGSHSAGACSVNSIPDSIRGTCCPSCPLSRGPLTPILLLSPLQAALALGGGREPPCGVSGRAHDLGRLLMRTFPPSRLRLGNVPPAGSEAPR